MMQTPGGHCSNETDRRWFHKQLQASGNILYFGRRVLVGVTEMSYWDFQPAGKLKYLILFPFQLFLNFKQNPHPSLPNNCFEGTGNPVLERHL